MISRDRPTLVCLIIALTLSAGTRGEVLYHATPLGGLPNSPWGDARAAAINESAQITGAACCLGPRNEFQAFLWDPRSGMKGLGDLPGGRRETSWGYAINNLMHVAGTGNSPNDIEAFLWRPQQGMIPLGELPGGVTYSEALGLNDLDQVVGVSDGPVGNAEAFLWDEQNGMIGLGDLPGGNFGSVAYDINNAGLVCGGAVSGRGAEAFIWDAVNGMRTLGNHPDAWPTVGRAINERGQVAGQGSTPRGIEGYVWDPNEGITWIGQLPGTRRPITSILALNDHGQLVGWGKLDLFEWEAIIWDAENGLRMLDDLLDAASQQYTGLRFGVGINNAGQIAASDSVFGFLLTPFVLADMNCDDAVNAGDVDAFFLALVDYERYEGQYPSCHGDWAGDVNQDARFDAADIDAFFKLLGG